MNILVTGSAGFIGSNLVDKLLSLGHFVYGIDNYDGFYEKATKLKNQTEHFKHPNHVFFEEDIRNINRIKTENKIDCIVHLAAKAGVRPSIDNPVEYFDVNINGTLQVLEFAKQNNIKQFVFASSSSVYGINESFPWVESDYDLKPISPYASSKLACEKLGYTYSHLYDIRFVALRFFTVFGPRQRPDLAIAKFIKKIIGGEAIEIYGKGDTTRDYTYVEDIVQGILSSISYQEKQFVIFNLGNNKTVSLLDLIEKIESTTGRKANILFKEEQSGDVPHTCADIHKAIESLSYRPATSIEVGLQKQYEYIINTAINTD